MRHLTALASWAPLPPPLQRYLAGRYPALRPKLVLNPYIDTDVAAELFAYRPPVAAVERMVRVTKNQELINALVDSGECRDKVVERLVEHWHLDAGRQVRLAQAGRLSAVSADRLLRSKGLVTAAGAQLIERAGPAEQLAWLVHNEASLDDSVVWERLVGLCSTPLPHPGTYRLEVILHRRPALRSLAAASGIGQLVEAAAACELDTDAQADVISHWARSLESQKSPKMRYALNLLDRTATLAEHRRDICARADRFGLTGEIYAADVPGEVSPYPMGVKLADIDDISVLELLCYRSKAGNVDLSRHLQWSDMAASSHLDGRVAMRLLTKLAGSSDDRVPAFETLCERFPTLKVPESLIRDHERARSIGGASAGPVAETKRRTSPSRSTEPFAYDGDPEVNSSGWNAEPFAGDPYGAGRRLSETLGDDIDAWELAFGLFDSFDGKTSELALLAKSTLVR